MDRMQAHFSGTGARPNCGTTAFSRVANWELHGDAVNRSFAAMLKGVDITEVVSPARVTQLCAKHGLLVGDVCDLRDG